MTDEHLTPNPENYWQEHLSAEGQSKYSHKAAALSKEKHEDAIEEIKELTGGQCKTLDLYEWHRNV